MTNSISEWGRNKDLDIDARSCSMAVKISVRQRKALRRIQESTGKAAGTLIYEAAQETLNRYVAEAE